MRTIRAIALCATAAVAATATYGRAGATTAGKPRTAGGEDALSVSLAVGGRTYTAAGNGQCRHAPMAAIYGVRAQMWIVEYAASGDAGLQRVNLTVWRPAAGGAEQMSLNVRAGSIERRIDTVKRGAGSAPVGSGAVAVRTQGRGGRFEIDGRDATGTTIRGTLSCARFAPVKAEGG